VDSQIVGDVNENLVKLTKLKGEFVWTITSVRMNAPSPGSTRH